MALILAKPQRRVNTGIPYARSGWNAGQECRHKRNSFNPHIRSGESLSARMILMSVAGTPALRRFQS
jgi:hypothetical protein